MIRYTLKCANGHEAESWFRDSATYEAQESAGGLACAVCGSPEVARALMAPAVPARSNAAPPAAPEAAAAATLQPRTRAEKLLADLRRHIERTSDYVGPAFAREARRIHEGEVEHRPIWGEASLDDARALREDGVPVTPLPWMSRRDD